MVRMGFTNIVVVGRYLDFKTETNGLVRPANRFVYGQKMDEHAKFGYTVSKSISSDGQGSHNQLVECISHTMTLSTPNGRLCPFCPMESFESAKNFPPDEMDITEHRRSRSGFTG